MFRQRVSLQELAILCRNLGISLHSGISVVKAFELASRKASSALRNVLGDVVLQIKSGSDITSALEAHHGFFPDLFLDILSVGEQTGSLPEVLKSLALHYENNIRLRKEFISQITLPVVQLIAAIFIIAGMIYLLGWVGQQNAGQTIDILGWGLLGGWGALIWLSGWAIAAVSLFVGYQMVSSSLQGLKAVHQFLLGIPVVGTCLRSFAIARFSWAFHLTQQAGMPIDESLEASLRATSNGAFIAAGPEMISEVNAGATLTEAFERSGLFPIEFIQMVLVAETSGTVPEALDRLSPQFEENARRSMQALAAAAGWAIWAAVAAFIIYFILKIALWYVNLLNNAAQGL